MSRACVYYVRGGFHPENCTGCFSGPDRVNSSSCALPAGEACTYVCVHECESESAQSCVCIHNLSLYLCACVCVCVYAVGVELMEKATLSSAQVITYRRPFTKKKGGEKCLAE